MTVNEKRIKTINHPCAEASSFLTRLAHDHAPGNDYVHPESNDACRAIANCDLSEQDVAGWDFKKTGQANVNADGGTFAGAEFSESAIYDCDFVHSDFSGITATDCYISRTKFENCNLREADFSNTRLEDCDLSGADAQRIILRNAVLDRVFLVDTDLTHADLRGCDLRTAILWNTILDGANLEGALLPEFAVTSSSDPENMRNLFA